MAAHGKPTPAGPAPPPPEAKKTFMRRMFPFLLAANLFVGAYVLVRTYQKDSGKKDAATSTSSASSAAATADKPAEPIPAPRRVLPPIPEDEQRQLYKWMLEEKRKIKPRNAAEKKKLDEEKALLKEVIRAESLPSLHSTTSHSTVLARSKSPNTAFFSLFRSPIANIVIYVSKLNHISNAVAVGKREYNGNIEQDDLSFPVTSLRESMVIILYNADKELISKTELKTKTIVESGSTDVVLTLDSGEIILQLKFLLSDDDRKRIQEMRNSAMKRKQQEPLGDGHQLNFPDSLLSKRLIEKISNIESKGDQDHTKMRKSMSLDDLKDRETFSGIHVDAPMNASRDLLLQGGGGKIEDPTLEDLQDRKTLSGTNVDPPMKASRDLLLQDGGGKIEDPTPDDLQDRETFSGINVDPPMKASRDLLLQDGGGKIEDPTPDDLQDRETFSGINVDPPMKVSRDLLLQDGGGKIEDPTPDDLEDRETFSGINVDPPMKASRDLLLQGGSGKIEDPMPNDLHDRETFSGINVDPLMKASRDLLLQQGGGGKIEDPTLEDLQAIETFSEINVDPPMKASRDLLLQGGGGKIEDPNGSKKRHNKPESRSSSAVKKMISAFENTSSQGIFSSETNTSLMASDRRETSRSKAMVPLLDKGSNDRSFFADTQKLSESSNDKSGKHVSFQQKPGQTEATPNPYESRSRRPHSRDGASKQKVREHELSRSKRRYQTKHRRPIGPFSLEQLHPIGASRSYLQHPLSYLVATSSTSLHPHVCVTSASRELKHLLELEHLRSLKHIKPAYDKSLRVRKEIAESSSNDERIASTGSGGFPVLNGWLGVRAVIVVIACGAMFLNNRD
ncbi:hypothetical protein EJB05_55668 [Eragrostis curvula]|uniref:Uncharacterized protein n=1 Tax=Eragrostis curvula TaxID=38414 RepID=A0A5J9SJ88_9POAL|nr:hypothetical protein EJB05_55668 [Eragrostis curvula]